MLSQIYIYFQCLGSGSVGSARFWLPGSRSAKICRSTDPDPSQGAKKRPKTATKKRPKTATKKPKSELLNKREIKKFPDF